MKFEYEISVDDYVASQTLYYKLETGYKRFRRAAFWGGLGILFIAMAVREESPGWAPMFLAVIGAWWIFSSARILVPSWYIRRLYPQSGVSGKKFLAEVNEEGFAVVGDLCGWHVRWKGVSVKGENKDVFVLYGANTLFMFGKKYLTDDQQRELRRLAAL